MHKKLIDFAMGSPQSEWDEIEYRIWHGEHPHRAEIARVLRRNERAPTAVREYIGDILEGNIQRPRGHPMAEFFPFDIRGRYYSACLRG